MKLDVKYFEPMIGRILVQPGPIKKLTMTREVPDEEKIKELHKDRKDDDPIPETPFKEVKEKVRTHYRIGKILRTNESDSVFKEGDWIVYSEVRAVEFDLLSKKIDDEKAPRLMFHSDVVTKLTDEGITELGINK